MRIVALIPSRYESSRLPGKPLIKFGNNTMIQLTYLQTKKSKLIDDIFVLTDDNRIKNNIEEINGNVLMVHEKCQNGTDRICKALDKYNSILDKYDIIINVQGDEPFIDPNNIDLAIKKFTQIKDNNCKCSTLHYKIKKNSKLNDPSIVKLVLSNKNYILYGSRNCIPSNKDKNHDVEKFNYFAHIGLFVYDRKYLQEFKKTNTQLQLEEELEWLKILEQGYQIISTLVDNYEIGVNTYQEYKYLLNKYFSS